MTFRGFHSRDDLDLRNPRSRSRRIDRDAGLTLHYGGGGFAPSSHERCIDTWQSWQRYHMEDRGWVDIAYSFGFCNHGYVFAGRGFGVRTAANGTNAGNQRSLAACWIGGAKSRPTADALDAVDWLVGEVRRLGGNDRVWSHDDWKATACPGGHLRAHANLRDRRRIIDPVDVVLPSPVPKEFDVFLAEGLRNNAMVKVAQRSLNAYRPAFGLVVDGDFGPKTRDAVAAYQFSSDMLGVPGVRAGAIDGVTAARLFQYDPQKP